MSDRLARRVGACLGHCKCRWPAVHRPQFVQSKRFAERSILGSDLPWEFEDFFGAVSDVGAEGFRFDSRRIGGSDISCHNICHTIGESRVETRSRPSVDSNLVVDLPFVTGRVVCRPDRERCLTFSHPPTRTQLRVHSIGRLSGHR